MLRAILNKSWRQHPTKHQLYGHLPPITKTIQARRIRHAGHCWRSKDELISDVLLWTPHMAKQKQDDQLEHTYSNYVRIRDVGLKTCQRRWMIGRSGERGSGISVLAARYDDDIYRKLTNSSRRWPEGSHFNSYYTKMSNRALVLFPDFPTCYCSLPYNAVFYARGHQVPFLSLWYDSCWDRTSVCRTIGEQFFYISFCSYLSIYLSIYFISFISINLCILDCSYLSQFVYRSIHFTMK